MRFIPRHIGNRLISLALWNPATRPVVRLTRKTRLDELGVLSVRDFVCIDVEGSQRDGSNGTIIP